MRTMMSSLRIVFFYTFFGILWILFSDALLSFFIDDANTLSALQTYKGLFFVVITSLLLYFLIKRKIDEINAIQERLLEHQQRLEYVIEGANLGYWDWDYVHNSQWVNDKWLFFLGLKREDIEASVTDWSNRIHPSDKIIAQKAIESTIRHNKPYVIEFRMLHKDGHWVWIEGSGAVVKRDEKTGAPLRLAGTHRDISERKHSQAEMLFLALNDPLTKLPNRIYLREEFEKRCMNELPSMAFLFLDLDYFKTINDMYGHSVGDKVIKIVAKRFEKCLQENDFLARVGGDEFVVLTEGHLHVSTLCEALVASLLEPIFLEKDVFSLGVSIGVALSPHDGTNFEALFKNADTAMYEAKSRGKNRYVFYTQDMTDTIFRASKLDTEMKRAIERDEFIVYYQPQIDLQTGGVVGIEALVRWNDPIKGMIPPNAFIPRAEENRMIIPLGEMVMKKALSQLKVWQDEKLFKGRMAINISGIQMEEENFVEKIETLRQGIGVDASSIELEMTESYIMTKAASSIAMLQELKQLGFSISVDDFGTGYSSLSYLKQLPLDKLKIDRSFIKDLPDDMEDRAILRAIVSLAQGLGLDVLAEGVEEEEQKLFLLENGCLMAQGFLFAKPMSAQACEEYLRQN
ncbi:putative bifunctional diguanylate cyclase/phosphodiesterase [Sulfurospirillum barnesii]|uniref:PAS domain S-box/diguanylate cyclase (GGDEF) domain-containing protein n=1 Tax=Sulfurospirillum barnesii (strain ATCC 700032 / DSM 10660 / SES-3) TaxID=760154 RepID=I3XXX5_SULBS|nr:EAL domain-containing protein [Sulfurospirillum barnesii]AFL68799.1 PAS domain S-box/diguanylate cyclase (GGDEF) domain-containing protein [Sulfurospirillum barnesii SES-3]